MREQAAPRRERNLFRAPRLATLFPTPQADFPFVVLGNKVDVDAKRQAVQQSAVKAWCESKGGIPHFLVSAKEGTNVETGFLSVVTAAATRIKHEDPILPDTVKLELTRKDKSDGCAC